MKINVMGATGQLGKRVVRALLDRGVPPEDLVASARTIGRANDIAATGIEVRPADYENVDTLRAAFEGSDTLLLIPSLSPVETRILQHARALDAANSAGVRRVVFSSLVTAGFPDSRFAITPYFLYAESALRQRAREWTILRNGMYLDPVADWIPELVETGRLPYPVREGKVAYVCRDDLAGATAAALMENGHEGKVYELTGPQALSMEQVAGTISATVGSPVQFESVTDEEYSDVCRRGAEEVPEYLIRILVSIYHAVDNHEFEETTDHVERLSGIAPERAVDYFGRRSSIQGE